MMEVVSIDCVPMKMDGGYAETLIWMDEANADSIDADEVICHATNQGVLIQVKAAEFVSDNTLTALKPRHVKLLSRVMPVPSWKSMRVPFATCAEMLKHDSGKNTPLWQLAVEYEMARGNLA